MPENEKLKLKTFLLFRRPVMKDWAFVVFLAFLAINIYVFVFLNNQVPELAKGIENLFTDFNIFKLTWYAYLYFLPILIIRFVLSAIKIRKIK